MILLKRYNSIDLAKFLMALVVVAVHVDVFYNLHFIVSDLLFGVAVPFFFTSSGFLLQNKIEKSQDAYYVLKESFFKMLYIYLAWILVYLPISLYIYCNNDDEFIKDLTNWIHLFFLVGETKYAWTLWYLHAYSTALLLLCVFYRMNMQLFHIWIIALLLMLVGFFMKIGLDSNVTWLQSISIINKYLFVSPNRNGIYQGLALICTGMFLRVYFNVIKKSQIIGLISLLLYAFLYINDYPYALLFGGVGLFLLVISISLKDNSIYPKLRKYSMLVYFVHMYFIFVFFEVLNWKEEGRYSFFTMWLLIVVLSISTSYLIDKLKEFKYFHWLNFLLT